MLSYFKNFIRDTEFESMLRRVLNKRKTVFFDSTSYWENRYQNKGTSGAGSYGRLAEFKADVLNDFVLQNGVKSVVEFGSGDGNQLTLARYPNYLGVDVSSTAVNWCRERFAKDSTKTFLNSYEYVNEKADLSVSLDVIYHLVEDEIFHRYMNELFEAAIRYVIVYASNYDDPDYKSSHVRHRRFTDWVEVNRRDYRLVRKLVNAFPYEAADPNNTSFADFYFFERV